MKRVAEEMSDTEVIFTAEVPTSIHAIYMTIVVPVRKREISTTIAMLPKKCRQTTATEPATAVVRKWDALNVTEAAELSRLSSKATAAQWAPMQVAKILYLVNKKNFRNFHWSHERQGRKDLGESIGMLL